MKKIELGKNAVIQLGKHTILITNIFNVGFDIRNGLRHLFFVNHINDLCYDWYFGKTKPYEYIYSNKIFSKRLKDV